MKKYLGVKIIQAEPAWRYFHQIGGVYIYIKSEHPEMTENDKDLSDGYSCVDESGNKFWSPKDVFEKAYRTFDETKNVVTIDVDTRTAGWDIVGHVATMELPKKAFNWNFGQAIEALKQGKKVARAGWNKSKLWIDLAYTQQLAESVADTHIIIPVIEMKTIDCKSLFNWVASASDMIAEDWQIVE